VGHGDVKGGPDAEEGQPLLGEGAEARRIVSVRRSAMRERSPAATLP
jgi:hypothetical protein